MKKADFRLPSHAGFHATNEQIRPQLKGIYDEPFQ